MLLVGVYVLVKGNPFKGINSSFPLSKDSSNTDLVIKLQEKLIDSGADIVADGDFGAKTEEALINKTGKDNISWFDFTFKV